VLTSRHGRTTIPPQPAVSRRTAAAAEPEPESKSIEGKEWSKQLKPGIIKSRWPRKFAASIPQARDQVVGKDTTRSLR
jgi:hypothetical protein